VFHAARIPDLASARYAIAEGLLDMVGMTRAHIADPQLVNKLARGEQDRVRPCVGASYCMYKKVACLHNPATGREEMLPQVIARAAVAGRRVVVVGGGPAGLEAARVAAERGHNVVLFEAADRLGGQMLLAVRASWRRDLIGIIDWRVAKLEKLGVAVRLNSYADAAMVLAERPEVVIVATGGVPDILPVDGAAHCANVWEILTGDTAAQHEVLIYDGMGRHEAVSCALHLAERGHAVQFVTLDDVVGLEMGYSDRVIYRKRFAEHGVRVTTDQQLVSVRPLGNRLEASFRHELTGAVTTLAAAQVVVERGTAPVVEIFDALRPASANDGVAEIEPLLAGLPQPRLRDGFELHRIGDAVTSRNVHAAMYDALRLCMAL
jgi:hypothetical protein